ncbi:MAG: PEF-CTERM sorting domain-containing protein, partial [Candidatus Poseidoniales archaeon]
DEVSDIFVVDLDFDGYLDVVAAIEKDDEINWYDTAAIPEFPNILMPVLSVLAIMAFRRRKTL